MRVAIVGAGGVGGVFGAKLVGAGIDVTFIARGEHLKAMRTSGLRITGATDIHINPVQVTDDASSIAAVDYVLLTVKNWSIEEAAAQFKPVLKPDTAVVTLQNGVDAPERLARIIGQPHVMGGIAEIFASIEAPGIVNHVSPKACLRFGEMDHRRSERGERLAKICNDARLEAEFTTNIDTVLWRKFIMLLPTAGLTSLTGAAIGEIRDDPLAFALYQDCMREVIAIARAKNIELPSTVFEDTMAIIKTFQPQSRASMALDLKLGNRLELPWLNGAVSRFGKELDVPTPVNDMITVALKFRQDGQK